MDQPEMEKLCDRWLDAWTGGDAEKLLAFYAPDAHYEDPAKPDGLHGHEAMRPYLAKLLSRYPDWIWRRKSLHPVEGGFVVRHEAWIPLPDGRDPLVERCMDLVLLDAQGRITRNEVYFDRLAWMERLRAAAQ